MPAPSAKHTQQQRADNDNDNDDDDDDVDDDVVAGGAGQRVAALRCASHHAESSVQLNRASRQPFCAERKVDDEGDSGFVLACLRCLPVPACCCCPCAGSDVPCSAAAAAAAAVACQAKESITESSESASTRQQQAMATKLKLAKPTNPEGSFILLSFLFTLCFASPLMFFFSFIFSFS